MTWTVSLDPSEVATSRTELSLNTGPIQIDQAGIDWGDAAITAYMAQEKWGSSPVDYELPNRVVTIPLGLGMDDSGTFDTARDQLHQKVALLQREGGWLKRATATKKMYADVVNATLHEPDAFGETGGVEAGVMLTLECLPDFYGDEVTLDTINFTGAGASVLKSGGAQAAISGDYPARCRVILADTSGNAQNGVLWGLRSRRYDSASTAALVYEAEALTGLNGAASAARTGASGGSTMKLTAIPYQTGGLWVPMMLSDLSGSQLTHQGSYRVWARVYATDAGSQLRLVWGSGSLASPVTNDPASVPGTGQFYLVDLGSVRLDATPVAAGSWQGVFQVNDPNGSGTFEIDKVYLQPIDEASGREAALTLPSPTVLSAGNPSGTYADDASGGTVAWTTLGLFNVVLGAGATSHYLKLSNLGFAIPGGATIVGITARISRQATSVGPSDATVQLLKAGTRVGANKARAVPWNQLGILSYGGSSDLWGAAWTATDINNTGFGIEVQAVNLSASGATAYVGRDLTVTVYYKLSAGFTVAQDVVIAASGQAEIRTEGVYRPDPSSGAWGDVSTVLGDLPRLPPSGLEGRAVELLAKASRGDLGTDSVTSIDAALDTFTAQVKYRPTYLFRP